jgi:hypothetical protein
MRERPSRLAEALPQRRETLCPLGQPLLQLDEPLPQGHEALSGVTERLLVKKEPLLELGGAASRTQRDAAGGHAPARQSLSASAPPMISISSLVIAACLARL